MYKRQFSKWNLTKYRKQNTRLARRSTAGAADGLWQPKSSHRRSHRVHATLISGRANTETSAEDVVRVDESTVQNPIKCRSQPPERALAGPLGTSRSLTMSMEDLLIDKSETGLSQMRPAGLMALQLALLQTDFYYQSGSSKRGDQEIKHSGNDLNRSLDVTIGKPTYHIQDPVAHREVEEVLLQTSVWNAHLIENRTLTSDGQRYDGTMSGRMPTDLYNRFWLAINFISRGKRLASAWNVLREVCAATPSWIKTSQAHLLPWLAFTICYSQLVNDCSEAVDSVTDLTITSASLIFGLRHPITQVGQTLRYSDFRVEICELLLRRTIDIFHSILNEEQNGQIMIMAKLYGLLDRQEEYNEAVDEAMRTWAAQSQALAKMVRQNVPAET